MENGKVKTPVLWEYRVLRNTWLESEELNRLGAQGWELVDTTFNPKEFNVSQRTTYFFKRPVNG